MTGGIDGETSQLADFVKHCKAKEFGGHILGTFCRLGNMHVSGRALMWTTATLGAANRGEWMWIMAAERIRLHEKTMHSCVSDNWDLKW